MSRAGKQAAAALGVCVIGIGAWMAVSSTGTSQPSPGSRLTAQQEQSRWALPEVDLDDHGQGRDWPEHRDDYTAPAEELIEHADHLDFSRIPDGTRQQVEAELSRRDVLADELWLSYGSLLGASPDRPRPPMVAELDVFELAYVLLAVRAQTLAEQVHAADGRPDRVRGGLVDHELVSVEVARGCVSVAFAQDRYGRSWQAPVGPAGSASLADRVVAGVRVATDPAPTCAGAKVVLSRAAEQVLRG